MTADFNENPPSSIVQGASRRAKKRGSKTSRSRRSQRVGGREDIK